jgi:myosin heavy subunit
VLGRDDLFEVKHFAGSVTYEVGGFVLKNTDLLQPDLVDLLEAMAKQPDDDKSFVGRVFVASRPASKVDDQFAESGRTRAMAALETSSARFRKDLDDLQQTLDKTDHHFVRCVKSNRHKRAMEWDAPLVLNQLRYLSVMEMVRIRAEGYPTRLPFAELVAKFPELLWPTKFGWLPGVNDRRACEMLL